MVPPGNPRGESGSFRDPQSRVFYVGDEVFRALSPAGAEDFALLAASGLLGDPRIATTELADAELLDKLPDLPELIDEVTAVLHHERIPFVSYPYEWTFSMLKDAALLQLDLILAALDHDLMLKDSSPYNVQFRGARPLFIDVGSFERIREAELWVGHRQFCMLYLFPLLLQAHQGLAFQPWLRGSLEGIAPADMRALMSVRDRLRRGYLTQVFLQARLDRRGSAARPALRSALERPGLGKRLIHANVTKMRAMVSRLQWDPPDGVWLDYGTVNSYTERDAEQKDAFVRSVVASRRWPLVWDIGCNNGRHAVLAAEGADQVVAFDADPGPVELLYRRLREAGDDRILPLTVDLADPSPGLGWRGLERMPMLTRGRPDLVLALAVVHHVSIAANVPVREVVAGLAELGGTLIVEFPTREDPMVQKLLAPKRPGLHADYDRAHFEACLADAFDVRRTEELGSGTRVLYHATPR